MSFFLNKVLCKAQQVKTAGTLTEVLVTMNSKKTNASKMVPKHKFCTPTQFGKFQNFGPLQLLSQNKTGDFLY